MVVEVICQGLFSKFIFENVSNKEKSIYVTKCLGKKANWESWFEKFLLHGKEKGYKNFLVRNGSTSGVDQNEYEDALEVDMDLDEKL